MAIIKRPFRTDNGSGWDTHYFPTSADQVVEGVVKSQQDLNLVTQNGLLVDAKVLKEILGNLPKIKTGNVVLTYAHSAELKTQVNVGREWDNCIISAMARMVNGTPYTGSNLWNVVGEVKNGILMVAAYGAFVQGHLLSVDYVLMK